MYVSSVYSRRRVVHTEDCCYSKRVKAANQRRFATVEDAFASGFRLCRHCNPVARQFRQEQQAILDCCYRQGMTCFRVYAGIRVETPYSRWMIVPSARVGGTELYHRNTQKRETDSCYPGFHRQRVAYPTLLPHFTYILEHDRYRKANPLRSPKSAKEPAKKGTKRYRKEQKRARKRAKREAVRNVLTLFAQLDSAS